MIKIAVVGKMKNGALSELCSDYSERLSHFDKIQILEIKDSDTEREGEKILGALSGFRGRIYAMGEEGFETDSEGFSKILERDLLLGGSAFIIGGPYGLSDKVNKSAHSVLSLSKMTFTHEFARVLLLEQLYRAKSISAGSKYHH